MFICLEILLRETNPVGRSSLFPRNDHEITIAIHETSTFDKILYGTSPVVAAFREAMSESEFVEFGLVYGKLTYLKTMLERGIITVNEEIVLGLSTGVFYDNLTTDPRYIFHMRPYEPYLYFNRDRINTFLNNTLDNFLDGNFSANRYLSTDKWLYYGVMSDDELDEMLEVQKERFWGLEIDEFENNLKALEWLINYCENNQIRLRAVWMPLNPYGPIPEIFEEVSMKADDILSSRGIEVKDMKNHFPREYFHDLGHMNYEVGAIEFTKEIDLWLKR